VRQHAFGRALRDRADFHTSDGGFGGGSVAAIFGFHPPVHIVGRGGDGVRFDDIAGDVEADGFGVGVGCELAPGRDTNPAGVVCAAHVAVKGAGLEGIGRQRLLSGHGGGSGVQGFAVDRPAEVDLLTG